MYKKSSYEREEGKYRGSMCYQVHAIYHLKARSMVYRAIEAEFILLHICSIERGTNQSLHSDYANKLIDISKRETTVSNQFSGLYYMS
jgi:hypothetical protein